ncbi:ABC transporter ATP-binding protein [Phytomonospora endophytica]|uniref:Peptide/nickel transport system ATP-binding protein n=1 Tax=Phytomonospora endophytica TaxID=714109 RepID=A0A841FLH3_9ACTN|nr:ABC transporter ATP-binding protein [Phytomonospora endophytica]MBB6036805.1 peptide/nickel transport system ATP-binding protein [Phytomonospora endophytica]GIG68161.1 oligopeptide ABC transporter ATP-binding protein [Phytomonospora endophytica]
MPEPRIPAPRRPEAGTTLLELTGVEQTFHTKRGDVPAVAGVDLTVRAGKVLCLVGESGCGKTTTARAAAGLTRPTAGTVRFRGSDVSTLDAKGRQEFREAVQYIHQDPYASLNPVRTVYSTVTAGLRRHGHVRDRAEARRKAAELLERVDLTPAESYLDKYPHQLSGGQRQRVAIARALAMDSEVLIADESTSMLDVSIRVSLLNTLGRLRDQLNVGFLFITHDLAVAKYFAWDGDIAVMYLGRIVEQGPTPQIINDPQHPYTKALISAVCEPDPRLARAKKAVRLRGSEIPSLTELPNGCTFHPRCPLFEADTCDSAAPPLSLLDGGTRLLACHVVARDHEQAGVG